jgi:capsular polysaccharide biosynthesis protein
MSFKEQMVLFRDAELIIGPHGAGLTNMVWSTDTKVIEIFGSIFKPLYGVLADQIGHEYTYISGESLGYNTKKLNMNIKADIEKIEKEINKTTKEQS